MALTSRKRLLLSGASALALVVGSHAAMAASVTLTNGTFLGFWTTGGAAAPVYTTSGTISGDLSTASIIVTGSANNVAAVVNVDHNQTGNNADGILVNTSGTGGSVTLTVANGIGLTGGGSGPGIDLQVTGTDTVNVNLVGTTSTVTGAGAGSYGGIFMGYGGSTFQSNVTNAGTIIGGSNGAGIRIDATGSSSTITNSGSIVAGGGNSAGISVGSSIATIVNNSGGYIGGVGTGDGINVASGQNVTTLSNAGSIVGGVGGATGSGINFAGTTSSTIINSGVITTGATNADGITAAGAISGSITNSGTITGTGTGKGINIASITGDISNTGLLQGGTGGGLVTGGTVGGNIFNSGTITDTGVGGAGITLGGNVSGYISNSGKITATTTGKAIDVNSRTITGVLSNSGTITAATGVAISLTTGAVTGGITNSGTIQTTGNAKAIDLGTTSGTNVDNTGYISTGGASSVVSTTGAATSNITNAAAGQFVGGTNADVISLGGNLTGFVSNAGKITASGTGKGIDVNSRTVSSYISNSGTISSATGVAISLTTGAVSGGITNSGTIQTTGNAKAIDLGTTSGTNVTNTGYISTGGASSAISTTAAATANIINNTGGQIVGGANANTILIANTLTGSITNAGTIVASGTGSAITLTTGNISTKLLNSGVIQAASTSTNGAIYNAGTGTFTAVTNSGTITAGASTTKAINFASSTTATAITNSGLITGIVALGRADTLILNGGSINGAVTTADNGTNGSAVTVAATFGTQADIGASANVFQTATVSGGTFSLNNNLYAKNLTFTGGTTTLGANVNTGATGNITLNGGTISLGTYTLNVGAVTLANGVSNSTINLTIGNTTTGHIASTGNVTNSIATQTVYINPTVSGRTVVNGDKYVIFSAAGGTITNGATNFAVANGVNTNSLTWAISSVTSGTDAYGNSLAGTADIILTATVRSSDFTTVAGVSSVAAKSLNAAVSTGAPTALSAAVGTLTGAAADNAGAQLRPSINGSAMNAATTATGAALGTVAGHVGEVRLAQSGGTGINSGEAMRGLGAWMQGFGAYGDQGTRRGVDGYSASTGGLAIGADAKVADAIRAGVALSYAHTLVDDAGINKGNSTTVDSYQSTLYASYTGTPWYVDAALAFGLHDYDTVRKVAFTGFTDTAKGNHYGYQYTAKTDAGYPLPVGPLVLTPTAGLTYMHLDQSRYTESSSNGAALTVASRSANSVKSSLGGKVSSSFDAQDYKLTPEFRLAWQHEFISSTLNTNAAFSGGGSAFTVSGVKPATEAAVLGIGLQLATKDNLTLSANYDAEMKSQYISHNGMLQVRTEF